MGRRGKWAIGVLALALLAGGGVVWQRQNAGPAAGDGQAKAATPPGAAASQPAWQFRPDELVRPARQAMADVVAFSGPLVAPRSAVLRAKTAGTLLALTVAEGDRVRAGDLLGRIDQAELGSRLAERAAQIEAARAELAQARRSHASNQGLAQQGFISEMALQSSRAAVDTAAARLQAAEATLKTTQVAGRDARLVAPIAGIVAKRHVLPGEKVSSEQEVLTLVDLRQLELAGAVGTHEVSRLRPGMAVAVEVEGQAKPINARLARIAPAAEPGTRSIGVTVLLPNPDERLRAGQYAMARVALDDGTLRLTLPATAIGHTGGQAHVWTLADGRLLRRAITLGRSDEANGRVEVLSGLPDDAHVLGARFDGLREGAQASVLAAGAQPAPASSPASSAARAVGLAPSPGTPG